MEKLRNPQPVALKVEMNAEEHALYMQFKQMQQQKENLPRPQAMQEEEQKKPLVTDMRGKRH